MTLASTQRESERERRPLPVILSGAGTRGFARGLWRNGDNHGRSRRTEGRGAGGGWSGPRQYPRVLARSFAQPPSHPITRVSIIRNSQSTIHNPKSAIRNPHSLVTPASSSAPADATATPRPHRSAAARNHVLSPRSSQSTRGAPTRRVATVAFPGFGGQFPAHAGQHHGIARLDRAARGQTGPRIANQFRSVRAGAASRECACSLARC